MRLKIEHFLLTIGFNKPSFARALATAGFRCRIISVKLLKYLQNEQFLPAKIWQCNLTEFFKDFQILFPPGLFKKKDEKKFF